MQPGNSRSSRHRLVRDIFDEAVELPTEQRSVFVRQKANGDAELEADVTKLLHAIDNAQQGHFLEKPVWKPPEIPTPVREGMTFGVYTVVRPLGGGGMGAVFLVQRSDDVFRKMAALKVIRPECMTPDLLRRFQQERQILAELDHPNIARILDGGATSDGRPYFVMDYVEGEHIDRYCASRKFTVDQKVRLFVQVCQAVQYLHANRIIHRDLKPPNIVVTASGSVKLLDFGIAKALDGSAGMTKTAHLMTPAYASPEQLRGEPVTPASDVYALAILLCELLTGCRPFPAKADKPGDTPMAAARTPLLPSTVVGANPRLVSAENPGQLKHRLSGDLDRIMMLALRNEPERRYPNAGELAADLERHLTGRPVAARNDSVMYRASKFVRRNRGGVAVAAIILILAVVAVVQHIKLNEMERARMDEASKGIIRVVRSQAQNTGRTQMIPGAHGSSFMAPHVVTPAEVDDLHTLVAQDLGGSLAEAIRLKPGSTPERVQLLTEAEQYLHNFTKSAGNNSDVLREVAQGYLTIGDLRGYPKQANVGDPAGAIEAYGKARAILSKLPSSADVNQLTVTVNEHLSAVRGGGR